MKSFLEELTEEIKSTEIVSPEVGKVSLSGKIIGKIENEETKKICSLHNKLAEQAREMEKKHMEYHAMNPFLSEETEVCKKYGKESSEIGAKLNTLSALFWASVRKELNCFGEDSINLHSDWTVSATPSVESLFKLFQ